MPITQSTIESQLSTLIDRAEADNPRTPESIDLLATADGPVVAVGLSRRNAMYFPIDQAERITDEPEKIQPGYAVVELMTDERTGIKDPTVFDRVGSFQLIRDLHDASDEIVNAEYISVGEDWFNHTHHNRDHLARDYSDPAEYFRFGPF